MVGDPLGSVFDPAVFGLDPTGTCTACGRGYVATFAVLGGRLVVDALDVNLYDHANGGGGGPTGFTPRPRPSVNGVSPSGSRGPGGGLFANRYRGLAHPLEYTGDLLIGDGFLPELYDHMRSAAAWKYRSVIELAFEDGRLRRETEKSVEMAEVRARILSDRQRRYLAGRMERRPARSCQPT